MRFLALHFLTNGGDVVVNAHMIASLQPVKVGAQIGARIYVQGQPEGESFMVKESVEEVLHKIAVVTGDYAIN